MLIQMPFSGRAANVCWSRLYHREATELNCLVRVCNSLAERWNAIWLGDEG